MSLPHYRCLHGLGSPQHTYTGSGTRRTSIQPAPAVDRHLLRPSVALCGVLYLASWQIGAFQRVCAAAALAGKHSAPTRVQDETRVVLLPPLATQRQRTPSPHRPHTGPHSASQAPIGPPRTTRDHLGQAPGHDVGHPWILGASVQGGAPAAGPGGFRLAHHVQPAQRLSCPC